MTFSTFCEGIECIIPPMIIMFMALLPAMVFERKRLKRERELHLLNDKINEKRGFT